MKFHYLALPLCATATVDPFWHLFEDFKRDFDMSFKTPEEDSERFKIFKSNLKRAEQLSTLSSAEYGVTKFSHLTSDEFKKQYLGYKSTNSEKELLKSAKRVPDVEASFQPKSVDWTGTTATSAVKNQGACGSCWAFSATEAAETGYWMKTKKQAPVLAPQQVVCCDLTDMGCGGGNTLTAYDYMRKAGGMDKEEDYPYYSGSFGWTGFCKKNKEKKVAVKVGASTVVSQTAAGEPKMLKTIQQTPISICVDAETWQTYRGGVVDAKTCHTQMDHCVHLVGYNAEKNYWIAKNSWGEGWGEKGHIFVKAGENACGIALMATTVVADDLNASEEL